MVVFVHGIAQSRRVWRSVLGLGSDLANEFRVVAYDVRGHGDSDKPEGAGTYTDEGRLGADLEAVLGELAIERAVLVPWSYGGAVVGDFLRRFGPARVAGVFAVAAAVRLGRGTAAYYGPTMMDNARGLMSDNDAVYRAAAEAFASGCTNAAMPRFAEAAVAEMMRVPAWVRRALLTRSADYTAEFTSGTFPLAALQGAADRVVLPRLAEELVGARGALVLLPEVGHAPFIEAEAAFASALRSFVASSFAR